MQTEITKRGLRRALAAARASGQRIGLVPTMGYLHEGHLTLADRAREHADLVVMSIFVNPLQFSPAEDLVTYPRDLERDATIAAARGVDILFAPSADEMYGTDRPEVTVVAARLAKKLDGHFRPGHFEGVLTVVAKLFNVVQPDVAVFGEKDFQQSVLIRRMCRDLDFHTEIVLAPTVREEDGLALSSRNVYLGVQERQSALALSRGLQAAKRAFAAGERDPQRLLSAARAVFDADSAVRVQYVEVVDPRTLCTPPQAAADSVISVAAHVGTTRLIDNMVLGDA